MGPKYEVNAFTGYYPYPATDINQTGDGIYSRMQVASRTSIRSRMVAETISSKPSTSAR